MQKIKLLSIGLIVAVLALVAVGVQAATLSATISAPMAGATVTAGQALTLTGAATGGTGTYPSYRWSFSDSSTSIIGANQSITFATSGAKVITLTVTDSNGDSIATSTNITVASGSTGPVISGIGATNITQTSVTIVWATDVAADSRVIYDTVSHPTLGTAPNYGYANTTTVDMAKVTSHSVNITGLTPGTKYYFRVISAK